MTAPVFDTIDDLDVRGKTVLVRADLNVPMQDGAVSDTTRIDRLAPTLTELAGKGAKSVVLSHFGRPKGGPDARNSLRHVLPALSKAIGRDVAFAEDCVGEKAKAAIAGVAAGGLLSVAGGGDTVAALAHAGAEAKFTYISAAGGAFLEWLEGKDLPGVAALTK